MEKVKNKKVVVGVVVMSMLLAVFTLTAVAFLLGREVNTADTQAALVSTPFPAVSTGVIVNPASGPVLQNQVTNVNIVAIPVNSGNVAAIQMRLDFSNLVVTNIKVNPNGNSNYLVIGTCSNQQAFTSSTVCFDIASRTGVINPGDILATVSIKPSTYNTRDLKSMEILTGKNHGYMVGGKLFLSPTKRLAEYTHKGSNVPAPTSKPTVTSKPGVPTSTPTPTSKQTMPTPTPTSKRTVPTPTPTMKPTVTSIYQ